LKFLYSAVELWGYKGFGVLIFVGCFSTAAFYFSDFPLPLEIGLTVLSWVALLFVVPIYTIAGYLAFWIFAVVSTDSSPTFAMDTHFKFVGYAWAVIQLCGCAAWKRAESRREESEAKREAERRRAQEDEERKRRQAKLRERAKIMAENEEIHARISDLLSSCGAQATEMMRATGALEGTDTVESAALVLHDIASILIAFWSTGDLGREYIERLWRGIALRYLYKDENDEDETVISLYDCANSGDKPLKMVIPLDAHDRLQGTNLVSKAASAYLAIVSEVSNHCGDSLAVKLVTDAYLELLRPYIYEGGRDRYAGRSKSSAGSEAKRPSACEKCVNGYQLLDLPFGASKEEVKSRKRALAEILHPDQLGSKSEMARDAAEQQLKRINAACDHIVRCRFARSTRWSEAASSQ